MIPIIGIMMGCYIITRMISFITRKEERAESLLVKICAVITVVITIICMASLIMSSSQMKMPY